SDSSPLRVQPREAPLHLGYLRLQLWIGILPQIDELRVVRRRVLRVALGLVQLAQSLVRRREIERIVRADDAMQRRGAQEFRERRDRRVGVLFHVVRETGAGVVRLVLLPETV